MRELIIRCDHCGKVIEGNPYKVCLEQIDRETDDYSIEQTEDQKKVREMDWCEKCMRNLTVFLLDTSHKLLVAPPVQEEFALEVFRAAVISEPAENVIKEPETVSEPPEEVPDPDGSGAPKKRSKIDMGKLKTLYDAGWSAKQMAVEFSVTEGAIWNAVHRMKLQEEKDKCD